MKMNMNSDDIKKGEEQDYLVFTVMEGVAGFFWHDMVWGEDFEGWEPNMQRSLIYFHTREECCSNMKLEVPSLVTDLKQVGGFEEKDNYMLFRYQPEECAHEDPLPLADHEECHGDDVTTCKTCGTKFVCSHWCGYEEPEPDLPF